MSIPGQLFIGTLAPSDKKFLVPLVTNARKQGYERFVEPCAGALAMSCLAAECGYKSTQIDASDISLFSGVLGRAAMGVPLDKMGITADGFDADVLRDPAMVLYAQIYLKTLNKVGHEYFLQLLNDLRYRREEHLALLREQIDAIATRLKGLRYRDLCMWQHLDEALQDEHALIVICPPTYKAGYEKFFDTGGKMRWNEPSFGVFDPETGLSELYEKAKDAKALLICYEERDQGEPTGLEIYGRNAGRPGMNMYLTSNRPEEAIDLSGGKKIMRANPENIAPLKVPVLPHSHIVTDTSNIQLIPIKPENATYYRKLWTHNFVGGASSCAIGMFIDGFIAGIFGYDKMSVSLGGKSDLTFKFGMCAPSDQRLNRLLYMLAATSYAVAMQTDDLMREQLSGVQTVMLTKYPESKEMRGLMKLVRKETQKPLGFKLVYRVDIKDRSKEEVIQEWYRKEVQWQKQRAATKCSLTSETA